MSLLVALAAQKNRILPEPVSNAAKLGLELHYKLGGGKNIGLAKAIASGKPLDREQIEAIADFFETFEPDRKDPGWMNHDNPSPDWILWMLMGGEVACLWSIHYRNGCLHPNPMAYSEPSSIELSRLSWE